MSDLYEKDAYSWALSQADALRRRLANEIDWENVAEEIESVGRSQASELRSRYITLLMHLLKWQFQTERRSRSWANTIKRERREITSHLAENPGLQPRLQELLESAYETARIDASTETDLPEEAFPLANPFSLEAAMDENFWPEPPSAK
jgi:type I site-specific restriction-modification system R (restriction) subunit